MISTKGYVFLPKVCLNQEKHESNRIFRLTDKTIECVSLVTPKKV
jgi:hypothetical protein